VVVFSKTYCPYCTATKQLFSGMNIDAKVIELDKLDNGSEIQSALLDITGQRTVPNVFIKGKHLGGNDVTQAAAKNGKLKEMLG
jgi:glutaredoxin 3